MPVLKIIAKYRNRKMLKGTTNNFWPTHSTFHVLPFDATPNSLPVQVSMDELKAVFVVRDFKGNSGHVKKRRFLPTDRAQGEKLEVVFQDGETLEGSRMDVNPEALGFFLFPADREANNQRIFAVNSYIKSLRKL